MGMPRRRASALKTRARSAQSIVESLLTGILLVDEAGTITLVNRQAESLFGYSREESAASRSRCWCRSRFVRSIAGWSKTIFDRSGRGPRSAHEGFAACGRTGGSLDLQVVLNPLHRTAASLSSLRSSTSPSRSASELVQSVVEYSPDGTVMVDRYGRIVLVNQETERMFGFARDELLGQSLDVLIPERYRDHHHGRTVQFVAERRQRSMNQGRDLAARRQDGTTFPVDISLHSFDLNGENFAVASIRDMTERHHLREEGSRPIC